MASNENEDFEFRLRAEKEASASRLKQPSGPPAWKQAASLASRVGFGTVPMIAGEAGGAALGEIVGLASSPITGPAGPVLGPVVGRVAGGAAGNAVGDVGNAEVQTALGFRKQPSLREIGDIAKHGVKTGAIFSGAGLVLNPLIKGGTSLLKKPLSLATGLEERTLGNVLNRPRSILPEVLGGDRALGAPAKLNPLTGAIESPGRGVAEEYRAGRKLLSGGRNLGQMEGEVQGFLDKAKPKAAEVANEIDKALQRGEKILPQELVQAHEWVNSRLNQIEPAGGWKDATAEAKAARDDLFIFKARLQEAIKRDAPEFWNLIKDYGKAVSKREATTILPGGYGGRYLARRTIPLAAGLMRPQVAGGVLAAMSPLAASLVMAGGGSGLLGSTAAKSADYLRRRRKMVEDSNPQR